MHLSLRREGGTAVLEFDRPAKRNALTRQMLVAIPALLDEAVEEATTCVILTGSAGVFSAGVDRGEIGNGLLDLDVDQELALASKAIRRCPAPVIAVIEGFCIGGAVELALACDLRVIHGRAYFSLPAAQLGILYRPDGISEMIRVAGQDTATRLLVFGEQIGGHDAVIAGLATHSSDRPMDLAHELVGHAEGGVDRAVRASKLAVRSLAGGGQPADLEQVRRELLDSAERRQALGLRRSRKAPKGE